MAMSLSWMTTETTPDVDPTKNTSSFVRKSVRLVDWNEETRKKSKKIVTRFLLQPASAIHCDFELKLT
jgi:hypothetical protein